VRRKTQPKAPQRAKSVRQRESPFSWRARLLPAAVLAVTACSIVAIIWSATRWSADADRVQQASTNLEDATNVSLAPLSRQPAVPVRLEAQQPRPNTPQAAIEQLAEKANSERDNWQTEVLSEAASAQLGRLARWLEQPNPPTGDFLKSVVAGEFDCQPLRPADLREVYQDGIITVRRSADENSVDDAAKPVLPDGAGYAGADGFGRALAELDAALGSGSDRHVKFKLYRIESATADPPHSDGEDGSAFNTLVRYEASRHGPRGSRQQTAVWSCRWTYVPSDPNSSDQPVPLLTHISTARYEESQVDGLRGPTTVGGPLFVDCTESALANNASYRQQVLLGINHWVRRIPREFLGMLGYNGLAIGDVNGDGLDDLYMCDSGGLTNRLYVQQPDGTARDESAAAGVDFLDDSSGALLVDLDNDGDQDLVVAMDPNLQVAENDGTGRFKLHPPLEVSTDSLSICAADYDVDGDLDVYVCGYNVRKQDATNRGLPFPMPYHDANNGGRNVLLRNDGNFRFVDVTREAGLDENNSRFSMAAAWEDFDNDGDQDLYVANDFGRKNLYQNNGGHFTDIAAAAGVEDTGSGMSVSWDDYDRDGLMDLYVGNMWSSAGNRVTFQPKFAAGKTDAAVSRIRRMARGNTLFKNVSTDGRPQFTDVSEEEAVELGRWAWSSKFVDLTNDGWPDLIVTNGYVSNTIPHDL
jgi:hypothetical protein